MRKVVFKNQIYYYSLVTILIVLVGLNIVEIFDSNWMMLIPIVVQIVLLFLIFNRNQYAKIAIKMWLIELLITGGIQLFTGVFYMLADEARLSSLLIRLLFIVLEILLLFHLNSIEVIEEELS